MKQRLKFFDHSPLPNHVWKQVLIFSLGDSYHVNHDNTHVNKRIFFITALFPTMILTKSLVSVLKHNAKKVLKV